MPPKKQVANHGRASGRGNIGKGKGNALPSSSDSSRSQNDGSDYECEEIEVPLQCKERRPKGWSVPLTTTPTLVQQQPTIAPTLTQNVITQWQTHNLNQNKCLKPKVMHPIPLVCLKKKFYTNIIRKCD
ncbi:hypothetical protein Ancab_004163 [Ancistrocladus abbreviatus]